MQMQETFWSLLREPHPNAHTNLDKLVSTMITNGFVGPDRPVSANRLSHLASVNYPQMNNLLNRPGFVKVKRGDKSLGWYWLIALGTKYPAIFPVGVKILKEVNLEPINSEPITNNPQADKLLREQIKAKDLLKPGQVIISENDTFTGERTRQQIRDGWNSVLDKHIFTGEGTPIQVAEMAYTLTKHLKDGTLKITPDLNLS